MQNIAQMKKIKHPILHSPFQKSNWDIFVSRYICQNRTLGKGSWWNDNLISFYLQKSVKIELLTLNLNGSPNKRALFHTIIFSKLNVDIGHPRNMGWFGTTAFNDLSFFFLLGHGTSFRYVTTSKWPFSLAKSIGDFPNKFKMCGSDLVVARNLTISRRPSLAAWWIGVSPFEFIMSIVDVIWGRDFTISNWSFLIAKLIADWRSRRLLRAAQ